MCIRDSTYRYTRFPYPFRNAIQFLAGGLLQIMVGRFTVDGINHHLAGSNLDVYKRQIYDIYEEVVEVYILEVEGHYNSL